MMIPFTGFENHTNECTTRVQFTLTAEKIAWLEKNNHEYLQPINHLADITYVNSTVAQAWDMEIRS